MSDAKQPSTDRQDDELPKIPLVMVHDNQKDLNAERVRPYLECVAELELGETAEVKTRCLKELRVLISGDSLLRCPTDDAFLVKFLRVRKYRVKDAFNTIRTYLRTRQDHPEYFRELRLDSFMYDHLVRKHRLVIVLKERDSLGRAVMCLRIGAWNTSICSITDLIRAGIVFAECSSNEDETQINGLIGVIDFDGLQLYHLRHYVPVLRIVIHMVQDCYPVRIKAIYAMNCPRVFGTLLLLAKPFLKIKLLNRIYILRNGVEKLHDVISPELLPPEFSGTCHDYDVDSIEASLRKKQRYFERIEKYGYFT